MKSSRQCDLYYLLTYLLTGSDVHVFNLERRSWSLHLVSDETHLVGGGRSSHTAVAHRDKVLIIG